MSKKPRLDKIVSPAGVAQYPHLTAPDVYKKTSKYKTSLILNPDDEGVTEYLQKIEAASKAVYDAAVQELEASLDELKGKKLADAKKSIETLSCHTPIEPEYNDEGEETGRVVLKFSCASGGTIQSGPKKGLVWERNLPIFDTQKNKLDPDGLRLWGGSIIRVQCELVPFVMTSTDRAGVSLRLYAVQVIQLPEGGGDAGDGFGVEDGFVGTPASNKPKAPQPEEDEDDAPEDEDF